jgi:hypothetical protein
MPPRLCATNRIGSWHRHQTGPSYPVSRQPNIPRYQSPARCSRQDLDRAATRCSCFSTGTVLQLHPHCIRMSISAPRVCRLRKSLGQKTESEAELASLIWTSAVGGGSLGRKRFLIRFRLPDDATLWFVSLLALFRPSSHVYLGCPPRPCTKTMLRHVSQASSPSGMVVLDSRRPAPWPSVADELCIADTMHF